MRHLRSLTWFSILVLGLSACHFADEVPPDETVDTTGGTDTSTDTEGRVQQGPLDFIVNNRRDETVYIDYWLPLYFLQATETAVADVELFAPACTFDCSEVTELSSCCIDCAAAAPAVYVIPPRSNLVVQWDGRVWNEYSAPCGGQCSCFAGEAPVAGQYQVMVNPHATFECLAAGGCAESEDGVIWGAAVPNVDDGLWASFDLPTTSTAVEIEIPPR